MHEFLLAVYWRFWQGQLLPYAAQAKRALYAKLAKGLFARFYGKRCSKYSMTLDAKGRNADLRQRSCKSIVVDGLGQGPHWAGDDSRQSRQLPLTAYCFPL